MGPILFWKFRPSIRMVKQHEICLLGQRNLLHKTCVGPKREIFYGFFNVEISFISSLLSLGCSDKKACTWLTLALS